MADQQHVLTATRVRFEYRPGEPVLLNVSLQAQAGKLLCVLGPNGSGKTTLLKCLLGRIKPIGGEILLDGRSVSGYSTIELARLLSYVPQIPSSAFAFTVEQLVLMGRFAHVGPLGLAGAQDIAVAHEAMKMTDTLRFADRLLSELSGGEAQRVMIARALAQQPQVCLLDEPTSHLDIGNQLTIYRMMQRLAHDWQMGIVCVSHDVNLAARFADELLLMRKGEVIASGSVGDVINPETLKAAYEVDIDLIPTGDGEVPLIRAK